MSRKTLKPLANCQIRPGGICRAAWFWEEESPQPPQRASPLSIRRLVFGHRFEELSADYRTAQGRAAQDRAGIRCVAGTEHPNQYRPASGAETYRDRVDFRRSVGVGNAVLFEAIGDAGRERAHHRWSGGFQCALHRWRRLGDMPERHAWTSTRTARRSGFDKAEQVSYSSAGIEASVSVDPAAGGRLAIRAADLYATVARRCRGRGQSLSIRQDHHHQCGI